MWFSVQACLNTVTRMWVILVSSPVVSQLLSLAFARAAKKSKGEPQATTDKDLTKRTCPAVQTVAKADGGLGPSSKKTEPVQYHLFFMQECTRIVKETPSFKFTEIGKSLVSTWGKLSLTEKTTYKVGVESQPVALV